MTAPVIQTRLAPPLGNIGSPAALLTKTLLFVGDSSSGVMGRADISGPAKLRAYDKTNGSLVVQLDQLNALKLRGAKQPGSQKEE
jgi:hypothetical protein